MGQGDAFYGCDRGRDAPESNSFNPAKTTVSDFEGMCCTSNLQARICLNHCARVTLRFPAISTWQIQKKVFDVYPAYLASATPKVHRTKHTFEVLT